MRLDEDILIEAKQILKTLGLNFTEAVNIFANMVVQEKGLPFAVKIPNKETEKVTFEEFQEEAK